MWSELDADADVTAHQFGKGSCMCIQLRECRVVCYFLLRLAIYFPTGIARDNQPLSGPRTGVEAGHPKKFGTMFSKIAFACLAVLTISPALSLLKRVNCVIVGIRSSSPW